MVEGLQIMQLKPKSQDDTLAIGHRNSSTRIYSSHVSSEHRLFNDTITTGEIS